jgi:hypothetical protein
MKEISIIKKCEKATPILIEKSKPTSILVQKSKPEAIKIEFARGNDKTLEIFPVPSEVNVNVVVEEKKEKNIPVEESKQIEQEKKPPMNFVFVKPCARNISVQNEPKIKEDKIIPESTIRKTRMEYFL